MTINYGKGYTVFKDILVGEVFTILDILYLKIPPIDNDFGYNALVLDGEKSFFCFINEEQTIHNIFRNMDLH